MRLPDLRVLVDLSLLHPPDHIGFLTYQLSS